MLAAPAAAAPIGPAERPAAASAGGASATDAAAAELPADGAMLSGDISDLDSDGSDALSVDDDGDGDDEPLPAAAGPAPAATPAAGERMASAAEPFAPGEDSRYDLWDLGGGRRVVVRARVAGRGSAERCGGGAGRAGREVVVRSKMEYQEEAGLEETKVEEWAAWRAALHLRPDADLLVARVGVRSRKLLALEHPERNHILEGVVLEGGDPDSTFQLLEGILEAVTPLPEGSYLLAHAPGATTACCFKALDLDLATFEGGHVQPLPCDTSNVSAVFDLHAAHTTTYDQEASEAEYIPLRWEPQPDAPPQIRNTYPPVRASRLQPPPQDARVTRSGRQQGGGGRGPHSARGGARGRRQQSDAAAPAKRVRNEPPTAFTRLGVGADWDRVPQGLIPAPLNASALEDLRQALGEEI